MPAKTKKIIILAIAGVALTASVISYKMYNKKHFNVEDAAPASKISSVDLYQTFVTDSSLAKNKYIGDENNHKVIQVSGIINEVTKNQLQQTVIKLKTNTDGAFINCEMEGKVDSNIVAGNNIILKGICDGYLFEADLGIPGDVNFKGCFIIKE